MWNRDQPDWSLVALVAMIAGYLLFAVMIQKVFGC